MTDCPFTQCARRLGGIQGYADRWCRSNVDLAWAILGPGCGVILNIAFYHRPWAAVLVHFRGPSLPSGWPSALEIELVDWEKIKERVASERADISGSVDLRRMASGSENARGQGVSVAVRG